MANNKMLAKPISIKRNATVIGSLSAFIPKFIKVLYPVDINATDYAEQLQKQDVIIAFALFLVPFGVYLLSLISYRFATTPEEMDKTRKLKKDIKQLKKILKEADKNPDLYTSEKIAEFKEDYVDTQKMLSKIGRDSLKAN